MDPYRTADLKWRLGVFAAVALYALLMTRTIGIRPDHVFLSLFVFVLAAYGRRWGKLFLVDWSPFVFFWAAYDMMRGVADSIRGEINISGPFELEMALFGWLTPSDVPAFFFRDFHRVYENTLMVALLDVGSGLTYAMHFVSPLILGWLFWHTLNDRRAFYIYVYAFTALNIMALLTFMLYPVAPPWYVHAHGFEQPAEAMLDSSGGLIDFDRLIRARFFVSIYNTFNANYFAAIPSLHAGYPTTIALCIWLRFRGVSWLSFGYPMAAWLAAVYLNHHYIIDLIAGSAYAVIAYLLARHLIVPHVFDRLIDYDVTSRSALRPSELAEAGGTIRT